MKDKEWLKEEIGELPCVDAVFNSEGSSYIDSVVPVIAVYDLIDQLDEPETLSQNWIEKHKEYVRMDPHGWDTEQYAVAVGDLQNLLVPKQEFPVIPQWVADNIESKKRVGTRLNVAMSAFPETSLEKELNIDEHECNEIYARAWLDGFTIANEDEELWKPIENYEGLYEISNKGNVRSLDRDVQYKKTDFTMKITGVDLKPNVLKKGYLQVGLSKSGKRKSMLVHRLVMNAFNPTTDDNLQINHIDGNKENNEVLNLEWVTAIENTNHAYDTGLRDDTIGNNRKLTEDEVLEIIDLYETGNYTQKELGDKCNVGRNTIGEILLGKTWGWLTGITREVEKEQKYWVKLLNRNDGYLRLWRKKGDSEWREALGNSWYEETSGYEFEYKQKFTKKEILGFDKGDIYFEHFAVPVEELEEWY